MAGHHPSNCMIQPCPKQLAACAAGPSNVEVCGFEGLCNNGPSFINNGVDLGEFFLSCEVGVGSYLLVVGSVRYYGRDLSDMGIIERALTTITLFTLDLALPPILLSLWF